MKQNKVTEAKKRAQKKYDEKTQKVTLNFTPKTMNLYNQLKEYTDRTGESVNGFIKELIKDFFENGDSRVKKAPEKEVIPKNLNDMYSIYYTSYLYDESIQALIDNFGSDVTEKILNELYESLEFELNDVYEKCCDVFEEWIKELPDRIIDGEVVLEGGKDIAEILTDDMHEYTAL